MSEGELSLSMSRQEELEQEQPSMLSTSSARLQLASTDKDQVDGDMVCLKNEFGGFGVDDHGEEDPELMHDTVSAASSHDFHLSNRGGEDDCDDGDDHGVRKLEIQLSQPLTEQLSPVLVDQPIGTETTTSTGAPTAKENGTDEPNQGAAAYEDFLRQKLEGKAGYRDTLNKLMLQQPSQKRAALLAKQQQAGNTEDSMSSVLSGSHRPPVFLRQVQESLNRIQLDSSRAISGSGVERQAKQQASAIELQNQLNELLSGIVNNFSKKPGDKPADLFGQLKQSVTDLQEKTKTMQANLKDKESLARSKDQTLREQARKLESLECDLTLTNSKLAQVTSEKDQQIALLQAQLEKERVKNGHIASQVQQLSLKLRSGKAKYLEKCEQVRALQHDQKCFATSVDSIIATVNPTEQL